MVRPALPPPAQPPRPVWHVLRPGEELHRIWDPGERGWQCTDFRSGQARYRFDHTCEGDTERAILYAAPALSCCVAERYCDVGMVEPGADRLGILRVERQIQLIDLRGIAARRAGTVAGIGSFVDVAFTQAWSRYLYETFGRADGLIYAAAHNGEDAIALYQRAAAKLTAAQDVALNDPRIRTALLLACERNNLPFVG